MRCPNYVLCGIVLGLAVLVGCAKKRKSEPVAAGNTDTTPAPSTVPAGTGQPAPPPAGRASGVYTAEGLQPFPGTGTDSGVVTGAPAPKIDAATTTGTGPVQLLQCQFDKVEAALTAAKGKVVLVDCWAVWCQPCVATFPKLVEKHEKYKGKGLVCLSVSLDAGQNTPDKVLAFLKQRNATFQNFYMTNPNDPKMDARFGKIEFIPYAVLFNKKGEKIWQGNPGGPNEAKVTGMIEAELAK